MKTLSTEKPVGVVIAIVCERSGGPFPYFVEVEDAQGRSFCAGTWRERPDGLLELVIDTAALPDLMRVEPVADVLAEE